jgi:hypothetical protein
MKTYEGVDVLIHLLLISVLVGGEWSTSRSGRFHSGEIAPGILMPYEAGWAAEPVRTTWRREKSCLYRDSNSDPSALQPVASRYIDSTILVVDGTIILKWLLKKQVEKLWTGIVCIRKGMSGGSLGKVEKNFGLLKHWDFLHSLIKC